VLDFNGNFLRVMAADVEFWERFLKESRMTGCLQLLEIYWNLKTLLEILEFLNLYDPPGNFCVKCR